MDRATIPGPHPRATIAPRFDGWDAGRYHQLSTPHVAWGSEVVNRLELSGHETVLDLGCGTGRLAATLLERLPRGRVIAVDGSPTMARMARAELDQRATVICSDLLSLRLDTPADAAVSSATFHWIADHERLFERVRDCLTPGAPLVVQCGGAGNIAGLMSVLETVCGETPFRVHVGGWAGPWHYATSETTRARLEQAGFEVQKCWLEPHPVTHERPREFLETIVLGPYLDRLPAELGAAFLDRILDALPDPPTLHFVRLNFIAHRGSGHARRKRAARSMDR